MFFLLDIWWKGSECHLAASCLSDGPLVPGDLIEKVRDINTMRPDSFATLFYEYARIIIS